MTFETLQLKDELIAGLAKQSITNPLAIQAASIPVALEGLDLIGQAHTGSGKTLAYLLPIFQKIDFSLKHSQAIILAPTHELVVQINDQIKRLATNSGLPVTSAVMMGGMNITKQIERLKKKPHIIVGSSGRVLELIQKKKLNLAGTQTLVIDEADNLLDKNQRDSILAIAKACLRDTQIMLFSATITADTRTLADSFMKTPTFINTSESLPLNPNITHRYVMCEKRKRFEMLRKLINTIQPQKALIFVNNIHEAEIIVEKLQYHKHLAGGLYSKQTKQQREAVMTQFKSGKLNLLVSSDLSARGLDITDITHVINMDLPINAFDYLHRAGRTARGTASGTSLAIITPQEERILKEYQKKLQVTLEPLK